MSIDNANIINDAVRVVRSYIVITNKSALFTRLNSTPPPACKYGADSEIPAIKSQQLPDEGLFGGGNVFA